MAPYISALIATVICCALSACSDAGNTGNADLRASTSPQETQECSVDDVKIDNLNWTYTEFKTVHVTGVLKLSCKHPAGVALAWSCKRSDNSIVFADRGSWVNSVSNISPNTEFPFELINDAPSEPSSCGVQVSEIKVW
jgi:hypothetical protein